MKREIGYTANDGTRFLNAEECKRYEHNVRLKSLVHMSDEQLEAALTRTDIQLADAIEFAGHLVAEKRRADGGVKRKRKTVAEKNAQGAAIVAAKAAEKAATQPTVKKASK